MAGVALVVTLGCRASEQPHAVEAAEQVQQSSGQPTRDSADRVEQGRELMNLGLQRVAPVHANVVDYEVLKAVLPVVRGWTQSSIRGEQSSMPFNVSRAEARYHRGDSSVDLEVIDTASNQLLLAPFAMFTGAGYSERSDDGFKRATTFRKQPGMEDWHSGSRRGEVTAIVNGRFIIRATGQDVEDLADVRQIMDAVSFAKLDALK